MKALKCCFALTVVMAATPLLASAEGGFFDSIKKSVTDTVNQTKEEIKKSADGATGNLLGDKKTTEQEPPRSSNNAEPTTITNPLEVLKRSVRETVEKGKNDITGSNEPLDNGAGTSPDRRARERVQPADVSRSSPAAVGRVAVAAGGATAMVSPATVGSPRGVDVVGLRLGMSPSEVKSALRAHDATLQPAEQYTQFVQPGMPKTQYLHSISAGDKDIAVMFATPPRDSLVTEVRRAVQYPSGQQPTLDNTLQALKQKYGEPTVEVGSGQQRAVVSVMLWLFDQSGQLIAASDTERAKQCSPLMVTREALDKGACGISLSVQLFGDTTHGVAGLITTLTDALDNKRIAAETQAYIDNTLKAQAESVGAPKL